MFSDHCRSFLASGSNFYVMKTIASRRPIESILHHAGNSNFEQKFQKEASSMVYPNLWAPQLIPNNAPEDETKTNRKL